ncbi:Phosphomannomutase/phosphoglucomutase [bioreactor metagenome]|jgi:phosphomannomutase|uniref:Phosphomannomutase/phosphoglucomutase n=1 Tax=bioreactor metagenome TaxID=1076179 RepID=A0A644VDV5_9ZZZZ|nr:phosphomannomutase/phosphoglucomutase [Bacteroidales bacterium]WRQ32024.1 phosphomannomutase/phosphoglucomutase [Bacteroidales bacterium MB20-C3-3]MBP6454571.1 phosphomannomutase/phosphoglucomutase [Bacteroidales bacterium]MBP8677346.1 phosphomannomutase/phosphoglucomutase [Bacteroidales bacterium]MBP9583942.1 phosphomannomutase/phosphoglucomutase [Bacteroidales bacterium]
MGAFHAYDIRGIYNKDFDRETVYRVGFFLPELLGADKVVVGRDDRESSPEIHKALLKGITDAGADVYDLGLSTTPMVYYATGKYGFKASAQITASHNPREYNGLKISRENALPVGFDTGLGTIKEWIETRELVAAGKRGEVHDLNIRQEYIEFLLKYKTDMSGLGIAMDLSNGMAALLIKDIMGEGGDNLHYIYDNMDGTFPNHEANPLIPENTLDLRNLVAQKGCDIGVIFDGDADRVMFVDENSRFISPDLMIALLGHYFLEERGERGPVLQDIRSSKAVGEYLTPMGGEIHTWRVGRAFAAHKLREINGIYGGELAGHYYFRDFFYSDSGIMAALIILGITAKLKKRGVKLSEAIAAIEKYDNSGEINFRIEKKREAMDKVRDYFLSEESAVASFDFDGYRVEFPEWWFNIRPSNTEPYLRFLAEAKGADLLAQKVAKVKELLKEFE